LARGVGGPQQNEAGGASKNERRTPCARPTIQLGQGSCCAAMWRASAGRSDLPRSCDAEWTVQDARWQEHGPSDRQWITALPASKLEAWTAISGGDCGAQEGCRDIPAVAASNCRSLNVRSPKGCLVHNLSNGGARLTFLPPHSVPDTFKLCLAPGRGPSPGLSCCVALKARRGRGLSAALPGFARG